MLLCLLLLPAPLARADFFSSSPGPLVQAHAHLDNKEKCQECHVGQRDLSQEKCLACHKPRADDGHLFSAAQFRAAAGQPPR